MKIILVFLTCMTLLTISIKASANWQCTVMNPKKNQTWVGIGPTRAMAIQNAIRFCQQNSSHKRLCRTVGCFLK